MKGACASVFDGVLWIMVSCGEAQCHDRTSFACGNLNKMTSVLNASPNLTSYNLMLHRVKSGLLRLPKWQLF